MLKNGRLPCTIPSLVLPFGFVKRIDQSAGRVSESTAEAVVLCCDEAAMRGRVYARLVVTTVTISE